MIALAVAAAVVVDSWLERNFAFEELNAAGVKRNCLVAGLFVMH